MQSLGWGKQAEDACWKIWMGGLRLHLASIEVLLLVWQRVTRKSRQGC
jgi:hypothetical protein